jgi:hypothetical protein
MTMRPPAQRAPPRRLSLDASDDDDDDDDAVGGRYVTVCPHRGDGGLPRSITCRHERVLMSNTCASVNNRVCWPRERETPPNTHTSLPTAQLA